MIEASSQYLKALGTLSGDDQTRVNAVITAVTKGMLRYLRRDLLSATYTKLCRIKGRKIFLTAYPVEVVQRVMTNKATALTATYSGVNGRISVASDKLIVGSTDITFADHTTIGALATAIAGID